MRVILDTNILLSGLISRSGIPAKIADAWLTGEFLLVSHPLQLDELRDTTRRETMRQLIQPSRAGRLINNIAARALMPGRLPHVERSPDPDDDFLLALSEAGRADWLVTGDKRDLLALQSHSGTRIVSATTFAGHIAI